MLLMLLLHIAPAGAAGIVTTLPPLAGLVLMLDGKAEVHCLLPPGADAHDFQVTPRQAQSLREADLLIRASFDDRHWSGVQLQERTLDLWPTRSHAWLSAKDVRSKLPELAQALQRLYPQRSAQIQAALGRALDLCDTMDGLWDKALAPWRSAGVIMQHNAWQSMLQEHGVPVWSVLENGHHGESIAPHRLEDALNLLHAHPSALLWGNQRHAGKALQWLQEHSDGADTPLLNFDPLGDCGMRWPQLMQRNLDILTQAGRP